MTSQLRGRAGKPSPQRHGGRSVAALVFAAVLTFGPGALAAQAATPDFAAAPDAVAAAVETPATLDAAPAAEAQQAPAAVPAPAPEVAPAPTAAPAPEALTQEAPDPAPAPEVAPEPAPEAAPVPAVAPAEPPEVAPSAIATQAPAQAVPAAMPEPAVTPEPAATPGPAVKSAKKDAQPAAPEAGEKKGGNGNENPGLNISICHATGNPGHWVTLAANANGTVSGHAGHQDGRDIIQPFSYMHDGVTSSFPGQNWDAEGQAIFANGCADPYTPGPSPYDPTLVLTPPECPGPDAPFPTSFAVVVTLLPGASPHFLRVTAGTWSSGTITVAESGTYMLPMNGPGVYDVTLFKPDGVTPAVGTAFALDGCEEPVPLLPLDLGLTVDQCTVPGGELATSGLANISGTIVGETYRVTLVHDGLTVWTEDVLATANHMDIAVPLSGSGVYMATVSYQDDSASATMTLNDCPLVPPEPPVLNLTLAFDQCAAPGGELAASALAHLTGVEVGESYRVTLQKDGVEVFATDVVATATAFDTVVPLSGEGDYTARVQHGDSSATASATLSACPSVTPPVTPPVNPPVTPPVTPPVNPPVTPPVTPPGVVTTVSTPVPRTTVKSSVPKLVVTGGAHPGSELAAAGLAVMAGLAAITAASVRRRLNGGNARG